MELELGDRGYEPSDQMFGLRRQLNILGKIQRILPRDNLPIRIVRILGAKRRPTDEALEHDGAQRPPIAFVRVALAAEDLGRDVIGRADGRVGHDAAGFAPGVDLGAVADGEVDLVEGDGVAVARLVGAAFEQLLVVGVFVLFVEAGGEAEVGEFDVSAAVEEDVVGFDVAGRLLVWVLVMKMMALD